MDAKLSLAVAGGTVAFVYATFAAHMPPVIDARAAAPNDKLMSSSCKSASWMAAAGVIAVSLITKDMTVFVAGGSTVVAMTWLHRHANAYDPQIGSAVVPNARQLQAATLAATAPTVK